MAELIIMPKLGFNMSEGKLVKWHKAQGEAIKKGEPLFSVETDKTSMDIEATSDGTVRKLLIEEGDKIPVTLPIAIVGDASESIDDLVADAMAQLGYDSLENTTLQKVDEIPISTARASMPQSAPMRQGGHLKITPRARRVAKELGIDLQGIDIAGTGFGGGICEKDIFSYQESLVKNQAKLSPLARNMVATEGLDPAQLSGSGPRGKIIKNDVLAAMADNAAAPSAVAVAEATVKYSTDGKEILEEIPYAGVRKIIGDRLSESKFTAPHVYFTQKVNLEKLLELRKDVNNAQAQKTSVTDFIAKAAVLALQKYPEMNSALLGEIMVKYKTVNLGIAVASPTGLIVPVVKSAEQMGVVGIASTSSALFEKARAGKLTPDEYTGGTFTISNLGMFGIENFTAIINPPEVGILAISGTKDEPFVETKDDGTKELTIKPMMNIQLSVDHRVIDGLLAAQFVTEVKKLLENPVSLLI